MPTVGRAVMPFGLIRQGTPPTIHIVIKADGIEYKVPLVTKGKPEYINMIRVSRHITATECEGDIGVFNGPDQPTSMVRLNKMIIITFADAGIDWAVQDINTIKDILVARIRQIHNAFFNNAGEIE